MKPIGNKCGCGHARRFHQLYVGDCFAVENEYQCGCVGYVRNYLMVCSRERAITT